VVGFASQQELSEPRFATEVFRLAPADGRRMVRMQFAVEQKVGKEWRLIAPAVEAPNRERAVAFVAEESGEYRARALDDHQYELFWLPSWGLPERIG
jgi:hypothetical protein